MPLSRTASSPSSEAFEAAEALQLELAEPDIGDIAPRA